MGHVTQKSMQRPARSQSPKRVGSGPSRPPHSFIAGAFGRALGADGSGGEDGVVAVATGVRSAAAGPEFVSVMEPDDDGGRPLLDMAASVPEALLMRVRCAVRLWRGLISDFTNE